MRKKNVSIADFEGFFIECENDIAFDEYHINLTQIQMKNLKHIQNSMKSLNIVELPFTEKEFTNFLCMTELVEYIFDSRVEEIIANNEFIQDLVIEIDDLKDEIHGLDKEKSLLSKNVKKFKSKIKQLKKENKKLKANLKELAKSDMFFNSDNFME